MRTRRQLFLDMGTSLSTLALLPKELETGLPQREMAQGTGLVYKDQFLDHVLPARQSEPHRERPLRLKKFLEAFSARGLDQELVPIAPLGDSLPSIQAHHTAEHVASVRQILSLIHI